MKIAEVVSSLSNFETVEQVRSFAKSNFKMVGSGCTRAVYRVNNKLVLKVPLDQHAVKYNVQEGIAYKLLRNVLPLARVINFEEHGNWLLMEYAKRVRTKEQYSVCEALEKAGRLFNLGDLAPFNMGVIKGKVVLIDYAA